MDDVKSKMNPGCLVKFPNGLILPIIRKTNKGLLFAVGLKKVELDADSFHKCEFLGKLEPMDVKQQTLF